MNLLRLAPALLFLVACTATPRTTPATPAGPSEYFEVITLAHAHCNEVLQVLKSVYGPEIDGRIVTVGRTNSLVVTGAPADVSRIAATIRQLDDELRMGGPGDAGD